jgi:DNA-binding response OmpR family regulator
MTTQTVLLVDDDVELCEMLGEYLRNDGFDVDAAFSGPEALDRIADRDYDVVVLDVMLPVMNGFDVLRQLRNRSHLPVIMLTARGDDIDSIVGLELGADDYLAKPCNPRVLSARIRAVLRRVETAANEAGTRVLCIDDLELNTGNRKITQAGNLIALTSTEFSVLQLLLLNAGQVVSKEDMSEQVLGRRLGRYDRSLDMHVSNLRKKLGPAPNSQERIKTVRGIGYLYATS